MMKSSNNPIPKAEAIAQAETVWPEAPPAVELPTVPSAPTALDSVPPDPSGIPSLAAKVPGYEILGVLGEGGMGVVFQARHLVLNRFVALKMIRHAVYAREAERRRFRAEAEAVARLQHANIVQIFDVGEHDGLPFMALEFCPGGSLDKKLAGRPLPADEAAQLEEILARAVHAAHQKGLVHRDLKPANVLLAEDGTPKIGDFGLAKYLDGPGQTSMGVMVGTRNYMSPEQAAGDGKQVGPAADIWALGAILYEFLTGRPPFNAATPLDIALKLLDQEPAPPSELNPSVPAALEAICLRCLQKEPAKRYPSALARAEDLRRVREAEPTPLLTPRRPVIAKVRPSSLRAVAVLVAGVVLVSVATLLILWRGKDHSSADQSHSQPSAIDPVQPPEAIRVLGLDVEHFAKVTGGKAKRGVLGQRSFNTTLGDIVNVKARLSRPGYAYLIAFRPDGTEDLCYPSSEESAPPLSDSPRFPSPDKPEEDYELAEGTGLAAVAVVVLNRPIPYREWKGHRSPPVWGKYPALTGDGVVWDDGQEVTRLLPGDTRGKIQSPEKVALVRLTRWLRGDANVAAVAAITFPVLSREKP